MITVGIDTGGTFTDFVYKEGNNWKILKVLSTPENPALAVIKGLEQIGKNQKKNITHGTTVATNALLERKGAKTALITNKGFEDIIEIGRQNRERLYDLYYKREKIPVERKHRYGIDCRINSKGEIIKDIEEHEIEKVIQKLKSEGIESVAVSFLFSFLNPYHEKFVKERLEKEGFPVSVSSEILPEFREFERTATTVINAYVLPKMSSYLMFLKEHIGKDEILKIMQSNGGSISADLAAKEPVRTILSGPAGGIIGALNIGKKAGFEKLITFDMGGTSTDVSLIDRTPTYTTETKVAGLPVKVQMIDIYTIGAGGGSIAYIDKGGALKVGPESAGADPGPVCYGKGEKLTITDANLFLGRLVPEYFLGGNMKIYPEKVKEKFEEFSKEAGISPIELAEGIIRVANSNMEKALRVISVERGYNPQEFALFSFGGAGGLHAVELAKNLNIPKVIIPQNPGVLSAFGMLMADIVKDLSMTVMLKANLEEIKHIEKLFTLLKEKALEEMASEPVEDITFEYYLDMRYYGQSYEILVSFTPDFIETFHKTHEKLYGYKDETKPMEIVNIRLKAIGITEKPNLEPEVQEKPFSENAIIGKKKVIWNGKEEDFYIIDREKLHFGNKLPSGVIVVEYSSTIFIPPYAKAEVDPYKNLIINIT